MTTTLPDNVPSYLNGPDAGPDQWYYFDQSLWHNRKGTRFPDLPSLSELRTQQRVGIQITENGNLNIFIDGNYMKTVAIYWSPSTSSNIWSCGCGWQLY